MDSFRAINIPELRPKFDQHKGVIGTDIVALFTLVVFRDSGA
jgi:hypothetical protein